MHPLAQRITELTSKARRVAFGAAAGRLAAVVVGVALVLMAADYAMRLTDPGMRWLSAAVLLAAAATAAYRWLAPCDWRSVTPLSMAQQIQAAQPSLGSRLASAVEFLSQRNEDPTAGSTDLRRSVVIQAESDVERIDLNQVIDRRPLRHALRILSAGLMGFVVFGLADPAGLRTAAARLLTPWQDHQWPRQNHLSIAAAPDRIARGQDFQATIDDEQSAPLPRDLRTQFRTRVGGESRVEEQRLPASGATATLLRENVQQAFSYRVLGGDDLSMPWRQVEVVDPPRVDKLLLEAAPPAYSGLDRCELLDEQRVLAGSMIHLSGETRERLVSAYLEVSLDGEEPTLLPLTLSPQRGSAAHALRLDEPWKAKASSDEAVNATCRVRLEAEQDLVGYTRARRVRIEPDPPPSVQWITPTREVLVTNQAVVPISVLAEDNLSIAEAEFRWKKLVDSAGEAQEPTPDGRANIYQGPSEPPRRGAAVWGVPADSREAAYAFDLSQLDLAPGDQLSILVVASDYRPGVGATPLPQRITILSEEEFDARLADKQSDLMQDLERLLGEQRQARKGAGELAIERQNGQPADRAAVDRLAALGFEQMRVNDGVGDPARGAVRQAQDLLEELKMNRQQRPELAEQLESIRQELIRLAEGPLASAGRDLADARRAAQQAMEQEDQAGPKPAEQQLDKSLLDATAQQDRSIESLESLVEQMADWSNYQRFAQELADLENRQRELRGETLKEATRAAAAGQNDPQRAAERDKLRAAQGEIARRFGKLLDAMRRSAASSPGESSPSEQALKDALAESQDRATAGRLSEAERQLRNGQLGLSAREQQQGAEDLKEMLDILRDRASADPARLAEQLGKAQEKLNELQKELDELQKQADQPGQQQPREKLADKTERLGRRLNRLDAPQAGESAQQGAGQMQQSAEQDQQGEQGRQSLGKAQENLERAQEQLAERIKQLKDILALRVLDRLAARIDGFIDRQKEVMEGTVRADQETQAGVAREQLSEPIERLTDQQQALRTDVDVARRNVAEREVFELALRGAVDQMDGALKRLTAELVDRPTQQREYDALERLKHISDALKLNPPDPEENEQQGGGGQGGGQPKPPSPIDVAELKMLRIMQLDLNARTRRLEAEAADQNLTPRDAKQESERLSDEQERLGELVRELIERNNEPPPQPGELPDDAV